MNRCFYVAKVKIYGRWFYLNWGVGEYETAYILSEDPTKAIRWEDPEQVRPRWTSLAAGLKGDLKEEDWEVIVERVDASTRIVRDGREGVRWCLVGTVREYAYLCPVDKLQDLRGYLETTGNYDNFSPDFPEYAYAISRGTLFTRDWGTEEPKFTFSKPSTLGLLTGDPVEYTVNY